MLGAMGSSGASPSTKLIVAGAILLFASILVTVGMHSVVDTGTCSSTGYSGDFGPVPYCPKGTGFSFAFLFVGIFLIIGASIALGGGALGLLFVAIGLGSLGAGVGPTAHSSSKAFCIIFGAAFLLPGLAVFVAGTLLGHTPRSVRRRIAARSQGTTTPPGLAGLGSFSPGVQVSRPTSLAASSSLSPPSSLGSPAAGRAHSPPPRDLAGRLEELADLHTEGTLTDDEFRAAKKRILDDG
jgi:hypothetical protein